MRARVCIAGSAIILSLSGCTGTPQPVETVYVTESASPLPVAPQTSTFDEMAYEEQCLNSVESMRESAQRMSIQSQDLSYRASQMDSMPDEQAQLRFQSYDLWSQSQDLFAQADELEATC